jgi:ubiquinone/menaquinone biosynthesis C-methylase UbiE
MSRARYVLTVVSVAVAAACHASTIAPPSPGFPRPARAVASIVAPSYGDEHARDRQREAERVMDHLGITPGVRVADLGAGDGYYTVRLARRLGPGAVIYAEDVQRRYLRQLEKRLAREGIQGVIVVHGTPGDPRLPPESVDVALLGHVYHEIANPYEFLHRLRPALRPGGKLAIVEIDKPITDHGTPPALLRCELAAVGYEEKEFVSLAPADGYLAVFTPSAVLPAPSAIRPCKE